MTPKGKAIYLIEKFKTCCPHKEDIRKAIECTMVAVEEIIEQWDMYHTINPETLVERSLVYWYEVKKELEKLQNEI